MAGEVRSEAVKEDVFTIEELRKLEKLLRSKSVEPLKGYIFYAPVPGCEWLQPFSSV